MILVEIRPKGTKTTTVTVHPKVTVLRGLDDAGRHAWVGDLAKALRGHDSSEVEVEVEIDGERLVLTPDAARRLGLDASCDVSVGPVDLPGARPAAAAPPAADTGRGDVEEAEARVAECRERLADSRRAAAEAEAELERAASGLEDGVAERIPGLESALDAARSVTEDARRRLVDAETRVARVREERSAERAERRATLERLQTERASLEASRSELVGRMIETGDPGDPKAVEEALSGLRRLQSVKSKPSARAIELADEWSQASARLAALPQPPQPPAWLMAPALEALQEARAAVAAADSGSDLADVDPARLEALDRAHREVLEAEQRAMKKSSRSNRKKLELAHEAEQAALSALGVSSYGEFLQHVAPNINGGGDREERLAAAKASLADAEAVWEELHGGQASPEWTEAKHHQAVVRHHALELLGRDVDDAELEDALRGHRETVVDTEWAEQALVTALHRAGLSDVDETDLEAVADSWLRESPAKREARAVLETELTAIDSRLAVVEEQLAERQADDFFGDDDDEAPEPTHGIESPAELQERLTEAEAAEREAESALQQTRAEVAALEARRASASELERAAVARRTDVVVAAAQLAESEAALEQATKAAEVTSTEAATVAASNGAVDLSAVEGIEAEAYLLARVAALRGATGGPLPMIVDGRIVTGLSERASRRVFRLFSRLADSMQLVVLADDEEVATWTEGLGDRAAVRTVAR